MEWTTNEESLKAIARVRGYLNAIFLSDVTTADGRSMEQFACKKGAWLARSKFVFPREQPSDDDWNLWTNFWKSWTRDNFELPSPLGAWVFPSHRIWEFYMHDSDKTI